MECRICISIRRGIYSFKRLHLFLIENKCMPNLVDFATEKTLSMYRNHYNTVANFKMNIDSSANFLMSFYIFSTFSI